MGLHTAMWTVGGRGEVNSWYRQGKGREGRGPTPPSDRVQEDWGQGGAFLQSWVYECRDGKERAQKGESVQLFQDRGQGLSPLAACVGFRKPSPGTHWALGSTLTPTSSQV